jgi:8-oxo-dGTP diphosphatase
VSDTDPLFGVGVLVVRDGKVLLGRRTSAHGRGTWAPPGGKAEPGETEDEAARRELAEETGLAGAVPRIVGETTDTFPPGDTWRTRWVLMDWVSGEAQVLEPDEVEDWGWYEWDRLPAPLFLPMASLVANGFDPFDRA